MQARYLISLAVVATNLCFFVVHVTHAAPTEGKIPAQVKDLVDTDGSQLLAQGRLAEAMIMGLLSEVVQSKSRLHNALAKLELLMKTATETPAEHQEKRNYLHKSGWGGGYGK